MWESQGWDEWQEDFYDEYGYYPEKGKQGKKGKGKGKKGHGLQQDEGIGQGDGKGEANFVNPSHVVRNQARSRHVCLRHRMLNVTHFSVNLTSVKMIESGEQQGKFLGQEPNPVKKAAFHTENQMPPTVVHESEHDPTIKLQN